MDLVERAWAPTKASQTTHALLYFLPLAPLGSSLGSSVQAKLSRYPR